MPGRNDPCPCGSGKKFKKCCGADSATTSTVAPASMVEAAFSFYQQGDFASAVNAAERALANRQHRPELYELLGAVYYQQGDISRAADAFSAQLNLQPGNAIAHNNLSLVLLAAGDWQRAYQHGQQAIKLQPELASAYNNLGNAYKCGHWLKQAEDSYQTAISKGYVNPGVYANLGVVLQEQSKWDEAEAAYRKALELDSDFYPALSNLAVLLQKLKRFEEAEQAYQQLLAINPDDVELQTNVGSFYQEQGDQTKAKQYLARALELNPHYLGAHINLGLLYEQAGESVQAIASYEQALRIDSTDATANYNLASILHQRGESQRALDLYRAAIKSDPYMAVACAGMAQLLLETDQYDLAEEYIARAVELDPKNSLSVRSQCEFFIRQQRYTDATELLQHLLANNPDDLKAYEILAHVLQESGDYDAAVDIYRELLKRAPFEYQYKFYWATLEEKRHNLQAARDLIDELLTQGYDDPDLIILLARIFLRQKRAEEALRILISISRDDLATRRSKRSYLFGLASVLEQLGRYSEAYDNYVEANNAKNELVLSTYDPENAKNNLTRIKSVFKPGWEQQLAVYRPTTAVQSPVPIFIVGFPRSGTTLLEQIIAAHPQVAAGGELVFIPELVNAEASRLLESDKPYPELLCDDKRPISQSDLLKLRQYYLDSVQKLNILRPQDSMFTDKMPLNLADLGIITLLFPESPILHIVRHPLDACFSSYISDFAFGNRYTESLEYTAQYYAAVMDLLQHYKSVLHMRYLEMRYEDLIADQETYTRQVIEFIGLPWDEQCLKFYESKRVANTASYAQVTQKIYSTSKYRYKNYYTQLQPLVPILQATIDYFGYSVEP